MGNVLKKIVGIASFSVLLQVGGSAQSLSSVAQEQASKSSGSSLSDSSNAASVEIAKPDEKASAEVPAAVSEPKISLKNPLLEVKIKPSATKMMRAFEMPNLDAMGQPIAFRATAYALPGRTRLGTAVRRGIIAADPRVLPLGSVVHIKSGDYSGVYTVHDTGGRIKGNVVDVWVPTRKEARLFGRRKINVNVLRLGPAGRSNR